ncbi:DNA-formamidopyrimidine glycosylase family protein [Streptomyces sp. TRM 70351]|uniref:DNA-formamidopyrimidine glycosylase family protein n=1 Tax=Streptomyces sp. TRM 70351 TaxID=3116552 RepID=UPI002E7B78DC|nr:DNA-formamidopyrimidine glycosylase family protein [Streptomyces sp. TRM 70351]MEE1926588.1 DNA-formamidopyrimidine glycosylase family protein [Streptomyces sp. TRM 70351]
MPEGDTVWRTARRLDQALSGARLTRADLRVPAFATARLTGREVLETVPRGKHLLTRLGGGLTLHSHLRMDGSWRTFADGERWSGGPGHEIRAVLGTAERTAVGYRLPVLELLPTAREEEVVGHLGPDLLGADWDAGEALRRLRADPGRAIGEALLDQRNLAGLGNVYRSELCFLVRIPPWTPVGLVPAPERLLALAHRLLDVNKARAERCTTGDRRRGRMLWVYGRGNRPCLRCGTPVRSADAGPASRAPRPVYWCPACQPEPSGTARPGPPRWAGPAGR